MKDVRPTSGRVLNALFSILGPLDGASFLDLFAGTGRVGLEAAERGASHVVWVEAVRQRAREIEAKAGENTVLSLELRRAVSWLGKRGMKFDVIFADPPYNDGWGAELLCVRGLRDLLAGGGTMIIEHSSREEIVLMPQWELVSCRDYGETKLTILRGADEA